MTSTRTKHTRGNVKLENGKILIFPISQPEVSLAKLLESAAADNLHSEVEIGDAVGQEIW